MRVQTNKCTCVGTPKVIYGCGYLHCSVAATVSLHSREPGDGCGARWWRGNTPLVIDALGGKGIPCCHKGKGVRVIPVWEKVAGKPAPAAYNAPAHHLGTIITKFLVRIPTFLSLAKGPHKISPCITWGVELNI